MVMEPLYRVAMPRSETWEGRSFSLDEFSMALEQGEAGTTPKDLLQSSIGE